QALQRIAELEAELASRVTKKEEAEAKTWAIQERKGKARWQTITRPLYVPSGIRRSGALPIKFGSELAAHTGRGKSLGLFR
ncbi:hypothetical protein IGA95_33980, partial [Pseudomonas aeruginosa]|uniref:hypothetical protein n=1 Tax=Pseudomonas aeruginosa TaxID=287 RepID=UPI0017854AD8